MRHYISLLQRKTFQNLNRTNLRFFTSSPKSSIDFDPYKTLEVDKSSDASAIKKAYYQLVKKYHPDVNKEPDADKKFLKIQESYEILSDKDKRQQYDQYGAAGFDPNGNPSSNPFGGGFSGGNPFGGQGGFGGFDFEDLFKEAFNGRNGSRSSHSFVTEHVGDHIEILKNVSFKDAIFGTKVNVSYKAVDTCNTCEGSGLKTGKKKSTCGTCHGTGQSTHILGGFRMQLTCNSCGGSGVTVSPSDRCGTCHGNGVEETTKSHSVDLPPGIANGSRLRIPEAGDSPFIAKDSYNRTKKGDLIIRVNVKSDPTFTRKNNNLVINQDVLMTTASLGGEIIVPTIDGQNIKLKVRPGVQNGKVLNIPDKGVPINRNLNNRGDLEVILNVKTLTPETPIQTALLEALADTFNDKNAKRTDAHWKLDIENEKIDQTVDEKDLHPSQLNRISKFLGKFFNTHKKTDDKDKKE